MVSAPFKRAGLESTSRPSLRLLTVCQIFASVGVSGWRKSRERWRIAGAMRWSFMGLRVRFPGLPPSPALPPSGEKGGPPVRSSQFSAARLPRIGLVRRGKTLGGGRPSPRRGEGRVRGVLPPLPLPSKPQIAEAKRREGKVGCHSLRSE